MGSFDSTSVVIFDLDFDRCRNSVKGQSRCLCACSSRAGAPGLCPGVVLQKMAYIQHDIKIQAVLPREKVL